MDISLKNIVPGCLNNVNRFSDELLSIYNFGKYFEKKF